MMYHVKISKQAETDLRDIYEYIAFELQVPENAAGQIDRLEEAILGLDHMPERFRVYEKEPWKSRGLHALCVEPFFLCFFRTLLYRNVQMQQELQGARRDIFMWVKEEMVRRANITTRTGKRREYRRGWPIMNILSGCFIGGLLIYFVVIAHEEFR